MKKEIEELKKRVEELEKRPQFMPVYCPIQTFPIPNSSVNPNLHYHGQMACYQNPCYWCGA